MLDKFRETAITWDKANRKVYEPLRVSAGDNKGRKLSVQVVNGGVVENITGSGLSLFWETMDKAHRGLDVFTAVDATKGEFEIYYTTGMLSNEGVLNANLVLVDTSGRVVSEPFTITVFKGIDDDAIQSSDSFTALAEALITVNQYNSRITNVESSKVDKSTFEQSTNDLTAQLQQTEQELSSQLAQKVGSGKRATLNDLDSEVISAIEGGAGTSFNLLSTPADKSVTPKKTSFIDVSTNLLDLSGGTEGLLDTATGEVVANSQYLTTKPITIDDEVGSVVFIGGNAIVALDGALNRIGSRSYTYSSTENVFNIPLGTSFLKVSISKNYLSTAQLNEGDTLLPYEPYHLPTIPKTLKVEEIDDFYQHINNLENKVKYVDNIYNGEYLTGLTISANTTVKYIYPSSNTDAQLAYLPVEIGKKYTVKATGNFINFNLAFSNGLTANTPIERVFSTQTDMTEKIEAVENVNGYEYLLIYATNSEGMLADVEVYEGDSAPENTPVIKVNEIEIAKKTDLDNLKLDRYSNYYESSYIDMYQPPTHTEIYDLYDELMSLTDGYITKTLLGVDGQGNNMYEYKFSKGEVTNDFGLLKPEIGIMSGLHGNEKAPVVGLYNVMKQIALNESENQIINKIKSNIDFYILPIGCPTGYDAHTRNNWNDVNINRNFNYKWEEYTETADKGIAPASELETQIIQSWMELNMFDIFIDYHRADMTANDDWATWFVARVGEEHDNDMNKEYYRVLTLLSTIWSERLDELPKNINFGHIKSYAKLPQSWQYAASLGKPSGLVEISETWRYFSTDYDKLKYRNTWATDIMANYIFEVAKRYI